MLGEDMDKAIICEQDYLLIVAEFDRLWGGKTTAQEQASMDYMIGLINAFDAAHAESSASMLNQRRASPAVHATQPMIRAEIQRTACLCGRP